MQQIADMTVRQFVAFRRLAKVIHHYMANPWDSYGYAMEGCSCLHCGYSLFKCSLNAVICEGCDTHHVACSFHLGMCADCGNCGDSCTADPCGDCGDLEHDTCEHCEKCSSCCTCQHCGYCGDVVEETCHRCYRCSDCCNCIGACTAVWKDMEPNAITSPKRSMVEDVLATVEPVSAMADFYLCEWVMAMAAMGRVIDPAIVKRAKATQDAIVELCEPAFMLYGPIAIGGELRHHGHAPDKGSRNGSGRFFLGLTQSAARGEQPFTTEQAFQDAADIFMDSSWSSGYGGKPWADCARTYAAYAAGKFSPKVFCDRVFSLQHNGGSFLNKMAWKAGNWSLESMLQVGNIHANAASDVDIAQLAIDQYPQSNYGACNCADCKAWNAPDTSGPRSTYCSDAALALWSAYRAGAARFRIEARKASYYGTVWA